MTDPRLVEPQRLVTAGDRAACGGEHVYWCWKRKTGAALLGAAVLGLVWWAVR
ncbi:MAG TPA: hypothetical protein VN088_10785 [Nocardioides sp.]|nr:hypothetical protein [Nocardioides sp.]